MNLNIIILIMEIAKYKINYYKKINLLRNDIYILIFYYNKISNTKLF